jgi:hypothetical protein
VEEMCTEEENLDSGHGHQPTLPHKFKPIKNPGPTTRSHIDANYGKEHDFVPSPDEECFPGDLECSDEDDTITPFPLPSGRKSRAKKMKDMRWYDQTLPDAHEQLFEKFCFGGVHPFT